MGKCRFSYVLLAIVFWMMSPLHASQKEASASPTETCGLAVMIGYGVYKIGNSVCGYLFGSSDYKKRGRSSNTWADFGEYNLRERLKELAEDKKKWQGKLATIHEEEQLIYDKHPELKDAVELSDKKGEEHA